MTSPTRELEAIIATAKTLLNGWPLYAEVEARLAQAPGGVGDSLGIRGGGISDPTGALVLRLEHYDEVRSGLTGALAQLTWVRDQASKLLKEHSSVAADADLELRRARCSDPVCAELAVKAGKCSPHYWHDYRESKKNA